MNEPTILKTGVRDVTFGKDVKIMDNANLYECTIGDNCFIGTFVEVQKGGKIGARTRVQSHSFICELVEIGEDCFIGHGVMFTNDKLTGNGKDATHGPAHGNKELWMQTKIGNRVSIGSNATILPVTICDDVVVGAGAVVTKDITEPGYYVGVPARPLKRE